VPAPVVEVKGGPELRRALKGIEDGLSDLKETHAKIANVVTPVSRRDAPHRSGVLASSIRGSGTASAAIVRAGGAKVPYAGVIHWGWPAHNIGAQPFLTDAGKATQPVWTGIYEHDVQHLIDAEITSKAMT
jgi:hypothetical protein